MPNQDFAALLAVYSNGDRGAFDQLVALVYDELRRLASYYLRQEAAGNTLQTTALVNEAYLRLAKSAPLSIQDRKHFMALAAQTMRRILVDHARSHQYQKRGGGAQRVSLEEAMTVCREQLPDLLSLDEALSRLEQAHPREAKIFELKFFSELEGKEIAELLGVSTATVSLDLKFARMWLRRALAEGTDGH
ncbi:MAG TPA: sigma-70 family RNA polymerase sigma factor [Blastocatellia bacterium]|nr:sigma-70 family RNA polymerase sigma factor [Blastocatellia bacterium]HMX29927.1 sigma-70 family RNA polymerase sigma factor [Blastocatellia bacterium]HMY75587.1 sigma-70 family RNA polymerase sigma factor [Blastocatellia bacterium]HMZ22201.1 sigma-70 family RNA polymerase sigma factor [Blastocatellia bacterium]HNG34707.1 sigma-70 family RNA polymerase sigma factor [Blastocatellia bacterium]